MESCIHDASQGAVAFAVLVLGLVDRLDDVGVTFGVLSDDSDGAVGRGVVVDDGLERERRFLHHKTIQALTQIRLMVINRATDRY